MSLGIPFAGGVFENVTFRDLQWWLLFHIYLKDVYTQNIWKYDGIANHEQGP